MKRGIPSELGLRAAFKKHKGASFGFIIKELYWELRYAWQRAWVGYDYTDVFELGHNFAARMPVLLRDFKENNIALFTDSETGQTFSETETDAILDEMIFYFENCDEDHVYERIHGVSGYAENEMYDMKKWTAAYEELKRCQSEALRLFSKWCWNLWY